MKGNKGSKLMIKFMRGNLVWFSSRLYSEAVTFNVFIFDLFVFTHDVDATSYAGYNTPYALPSKANLAFEKHGQCSGGLFTWFKGN